MNEELNVLKKLSRSKDPEILAFARGRLDELAAIEMGIISVGEVKLHGAAHRGELDKVPLGYMTEKNFRRKSSIYAEANVFCVAADAGHLDQIPEQFLTIENLMLPRDDGYSALELAASRGHLDQIPAGELTREKLMLGEPRRNYVLHLAAQSGSLHQLPKSVLVEEYLAGKKYNYQNVLQIAERNNYLDQLLGVELSESSRRFVGDKWWEKNQTVLRDKELLDATEDGVGLEIF